MRPLSRSAATLAAALATASTLALAPPAGAQLLHDNGPFLTNGRAGAGSADASLMTPPNTTYGFGNAFGSGYSVADDFTVGGTGWTVSGFRFFAFQTGSTMTASPMTGLYLQLWDARPDTPGAAVVWGDLSTNRLTGTGFTGVYRARYATPQDGTRPIMYLDVAVGALDLAAGTYWAQWSAEGVLSSGPWVPPISYPGSTQPTGDAMQLTSDWAMLIDATSGAAQGLPFEVHGTLVSAVPEPSTYVLIATGLAAIAGVARRRRQG